MTETAGWGDEIAAELIELAKHVDKDWTDVDKFFGPYTDKADVVALLLRARDKIVDLDSALGEQGVLLKDQRQLIDRQAEDLIALQNWWRSLGQPYYQEKFGKQLAKAMEIMTDLRESLAAQVDIPVRHSAMMEPET